MLIRLQRIYNFWLFHGIIWYVSNISIIFHCSMLYYVLFWSLLGFIIHFYIIFGTNLLTGGPAQNCCFFAYFSVSEKHNIKQSPNRMKPLGTGFLERTWSRRHGPYVKQPTGKPRGRGRAYPPGAPSTLVAPLLLHRCTSSSYIYPRTPKRSVRSQNPISTVATFSTSEIPSWGLSGAPPEGHRSWRASTSTP